MIRKKIVLYAVLGAAVFTFTAPSLAQNFFLSGSNNTEISNKKKDKGFFSNLFGWGDSDDEQKTIAVQVKGAVVELTSDVMSMSGSAPKTPEEYLARSKAMSAKYKQAARLETAISREKVAYAGQLFDQQVARSQAQQAQQKAFQPVTFTPSPANTGAQTGKAESKTIRSNTPLFQPKGQKKPSTGVFTKY